MECIGCGYCCTRATCTLGRGLHPLSPAVSLCPSLIWDNEKERHFCQLALDDEKYAKIIYANTGCCSALNSWRREPLQDRTVRNDEME